MDITVLLGLMFVVAAGVVMPLFSLFMCLGLAADRLLLQLTGGRSR